MSEHVPVTIPYLIMYGSIASPLLPLMVLQLGDKQLNHTLFIIKVLILLSFATDILMLTTALNGIRNSPIVHFYGLMEGVLLIIFFSRLINIGKERTTVLCSLYATLYVINSIIHENIFIFNSYARTFEALLMLCLCVVAFYNFYTKEEDIFIEKSPEFWIVIGILFYFSGAFFSFLFSTDILSKPPERLYSWVLHNISNLLKNILFAIGLWRIKT